MNKITKKGILATRVLENFPEDVLDTLFETQEETKPSRIEPRRKAQEKHEAKKRRREFEDYND
jgi:hypothetical protein